MEIEVALAHCCQNFAFNFDGKTVVYSHQERHQILRDFEEYIAGNQVRILEVPFDVPEDRFEAHQALSAHLGTLGEELHGYSIGHFFELPHRSRAQRLG